jgi:hypothetical protein
MQMQMQMQMQMPLNPKGQSLPKLPAPPAAARRI